MSQTPRTADGWSQLLRESRRPTSPEFWQSQQALVPRLTHAAQQLLRETRDLLQWPGLNSSDLERVGGTLQKALDLIRAVQVELARFASVMDDMVPVPLLDQALDQVAAWLDRISRQFAYLSQLATEAPVLRQEIQRLIERPGGAWLGVPWNGMRGLVDKWLSPSRWDLDPLSLDSELVHRVLQRKYQSEIIGSLLAQGLLTAPLVARASRNMWWGDDQAELVTIAALLQDCGSYVLGLHQSVSVSQTSRNSTQHPQVGAALVQNYIGPPVTLARLIAQHHERLTGTGFPRGCGAAELGGQARLLGAAVRFEELRRQFWTEAELLLPPDQADQQAIECLWVETLQGHWDQEYVERLLGQRDSQVVQESIVRARKRLAFDTPVETAASAQRGRPAQIPSPVGAPHIPVGPRRPNAADQSVLVSPAPLN